MAKGTWVVPFASAISLVDFKIFKIQNYCLVLILIHSVICSKPLPSAFPITSKRLRTASTCSYPNQAM